MRWLLFSLGLIVVGCTSLGSADPTPDPLLFLTPQPTRPTLALPTRAPARSTLPRIKSSFDLPSAPRTPFAFATALAATDSPEIGDPPGRPTEGTQSQPTSSPAEGTVTGSSQVAPSPTRAPTQTLAPRPTATARVETAHRFAVSARARLYYYCDTDSAWKGLSAANLRWYDTERALRADYPQLTLHETCR